MELMAVFTVLIFLLIIVGAILGSIAFNRVNTLQREVQILRQKYSQSMPVLKPGRTEPTQEINNTSEPEPPVAPFEKQAPIKISVASVNKPLVSEHIFTKRADEPVKKDVSPRADIDTTPFLISHLAENWMVWLGGACVALAGIFLAKYSIEQGWLGPVARISLGIITGLGLHTTALWLRAKFGDHPALAALAGGGSITLFAILLAALHFYQMFSTITVFILLAGVALVTMWLALIHGPVLAVIGMIGAYIVPIMVSHASGNVVLAMAYALIISTSILFLIQRLKVFTMWHAILWWGLMAGGLFWWAVSFTSSHPDGWRGLYLALFAYGLIAISQNGNWRLDKKIAAVVWPFNITLDKPAHKYNIDLTVLWRKPQAWLAPSLLFLVLAQLISVFSQGWQSQWLNWSLLAGVLLWVAGKQPKFAGLVWLLFIGEWLAILFSYVDSNHGQFFIQSLMPESIGSFFKYILGFTALFVFIALRNLSLGEAKSWWAAMISVPPVLSLLICHLLGARFTTDWQWAFVVLIMGASYVALATSGIKKQWTKELCVWLFLSGHFAYSFAASILLEQATLTLAISVQVLSVAWLIRRFDVVHIAWLLKIIVILVVVRLTLNPWLASYPTDAHWSLWTYGGATLFCFVPTRWLSDYRHLARWTEAAALHLFVLTVWSEARYWLYDGETFYADYTFSEATVTCLLFGALALVYHVKAKVSESLVEWYRTYSILLLMISAGNYAALLLSALASTYWSYSSIGSTPIWNILPIAYGLPVGLAYLVYRFYLAEYRKIAGLVAASAGFIFISLEIRHLWQGSIRLDLPTSDGELYTYSIVWLGLAVVSLLLGSWKFGRSCYQGGLIVLALVVVKIFMIDMAGLDGLLRVASFMGLGLSLLAVAFLHQRLSPSLYKQGA